VIKRLKGSGNLGAKVIAVLTALCVSQLLSAEPLPKQILFGDTHVHSTYSTDAFAGTLPLKQGASGTFPPADACDYARYVSQIDFYFLTDHAESYLPEYWQDAINSVQRCSRASDPGNAELVAFIGWEWSQVGITAESHYGHHNVLFKDIEREKLPARPIGAKGVATLGLRTSASRLPFGLEFMDFLNFGRYREFRRFGEALAEVPLCPDGVNSRKLPAECLELAGNPEELYTKLDEWGFDTLVVPHGSAWGMYTPPGASWQHQLKAKYHDPEKMKMIEVYSGHGNSENYRDFRARLLDKEGNPYCPKPSKDYLPTCWQAGEIIRKRCLAEGESVSECETRAVTARHDAVAVPHVGGWLSVQGTEVEDWLDAGQARDVYMPAFNYRPMKSAQYGLALRNFENPDSPLRYRWGLIGSTDTHTSRAGHGFKEYMRINSTEAGNRGGRSKWWHNMIYKDKKPLSQSLSLVDKDLVSLGLGATESERRASFLSLGGLVAVHAQGRSRDAIWEAMKRKEVYGTSGARIQLWFDLLNSSGDLSPMGSEVAMDENPRFRVTAVGSFKQRAGCPDSVKSVLSEKRLHKLAKGECYNPTDERRLISRIEVVRIRPQQHADEQVSALIEDLWRVFECAPSVEGCQVVFDDKAFAAGGRDSVYYVRAIEESTARVNGNNLRTTFDGEGRAVKTNPCYGDYRTDKQDDCLAPVGHRAWSSPIFVDYRK
jgi:Protein of unknown function (DUF3604)